MTYASRQPSLTFFLSLILFILLSFSANAQSTRVKGRVVDASTGEGIPFAGVYFKNSTVGVSTDIDGYYLIETRIDTLTVISATILGYQTDEHNVAVKAFNEINFSLEPILDELSASVVKPDDSYMRSILRKIDDAKKRNNPELRSEYNCKVYSKNELDVVNPQNPIISGLLPKDFKFVYDYVDTSVVSGLPYLPVMIAEAYSHFYHKLNPKADNEIIESSRISGIEYEKTIAQFTGNTYIKTNFYEDFINIFGIEIPSPASSSGMTYYNYYLVDSLNVDGRKTYKIRYHPSKWVSSPTFDGEMAVDAEEFALKEVHAKLKTGSNVNWIRSIMIDSENKRIADSTWFYAQNNAYVDFSVTMRDSSKMLSLIAKRQIDYTEPTFEPAPKKIFEKRYSNVQTSSNVLNQDESYWQKVRPYQLSEKEQGIYNMVDSIKNVPLYTTAEKVITTLAVGFYDFKYIGIGPYTSLYSFNDCEGDRVQFGFRTTKHLSKKFRLMTYGAYGFKDDKFKVGATFEYMFNNQPTRKLYAAYKHDVMQLGAGSQAFGNGNVVSSILSKSHSQKMSMVNDYTLSYEHEWTAGFTSTLGVESRRIYSNFFVPMFMKYNGLFLNSVGYNQAHLQMRFSKEETITRGTFDKYYVYSKYPTLSLDLIASLKGIGKNEYTYFRPEFNLYYTWLIPPFGSSRFNFNSGVIVGTVPYPMLKIHEGNGTYTFHKDVFACMDYYEFASDMWVALFWQHNFKGFFLGKIPLLKKLQLREVFSLRAAYGTLTDKNNGIRGDSHADSQMYFPAGMKYLNKPYVEMGVGITNILKVLRVDLFWRMTHRYDINPEGLRVPHDNRFVINIGFEFKL